MINITLARPYLPLEQCIDPMEPMWIPHDSQHCFRNADHLALNCCKASRWESNFSLFSGASVWSKRVSFITKSQMTLSPNVLHNGTAIDLPVSCAQKIFTRAVRDELAPALGRDTITYSTMTKYLGQLKFPPISVDRRGSTNDRYQSNNS
jgi:hypothetical protein